MVDDKKHLYSNGLVAILAGLSVGTFLDRNQLRLQFSNSTGTNYSLYQVETIFLLGLIGLGFGIPISYLQKHIKPYYIIVIGCLGGTIAFLLLWTGAETYEWYNNKAFVLAIFNFFAGYAVAHLYYTSLWVGFSASPNYLNLVTLLHHLPLVSSAVFLCGITRTSQSHLFAIQFCTTVLGSLSAIVLLKTSPTIEQPVRVIGEARRFTLPAYEYPASDTESIAESEVNYTEDEIRAPLLLAPNRLKRVLGDLKDAIPHIIVFAVGTAANMPVSFSVKPPFWRLGLSNGASLLACFLGSWRSIPRATFLTIIIGLRCLFLTVAIVRREAPADDFLFDTGGIVQGAFWTMLPQMLFELHGYKRITLLWSTAILSFALITCFQDFGLLLLLDSQSPLSICSPEKCPNLISEFQLAANVFTLIATFWLHSRTAYT